MKERIIERSEEVEIDLQRLIGVLLKKAWLIILSGVLFAAATLGVTKFVLTPKYQSSVMFYVNNNAFSVGDASFSLSTGDISASKSLVDSYIVILETRTTLNDVMDYANVDHTYKEMTEMITAESVNDTEIFEVKVTSTDPQEADRIADAIEYILPKRISTIVEGTSAQIVDSAIVASKPISPNPILNTAIGLMLGLMLSAAYIVLKEMFDVTVRSEEDIISVCDHPVLAAVPDMLSSSKGDRYYDSGRKKKRLPVPGRKKDVALVGGDISFAASEAYKLLRTKLQFSFADESNCHMIGISSALAGEGKSLTAINLAYSLAQLDKKVLLVDCDLRRPSIAEKLTIEKGPGLSDYLTRQKRIEEVVQVCDMGYRAVFNVIASGPNPPNPIELLSSARMGKALQSFKDYYDYIILDLPPVEEVSDAMVVAKIVDGILLVTRQDYGNRVVFGSAVKEFEFIDAKILGVVFNCTTDNGASYRSRYSKRYYGRYAGKYYGYRAAREAEIAQQMEAEEGDE